MLQRVNSDVVNLFSALCWTTQCEGGPQLHFFTPIWAFSFSRVPARLPSAGVEVPAVAPEAWALVASPLRAIADAVYLNKEITWQGHGPGYLTASLGMEQDDHEGLRVWGSEFFLHRLDRMSIVSA